MILPMENLGEFGIITDQQPNKLSLNVWTKGRNVRFEYGEILKMGGYSDLLSLTDPALWALPVQYGDFAYWVTCSVDSIYAWDGQTNDDITGTTTPSGTADDKWNGGIFAGVVVLNNGVNVPQYWVPDTAAAADLLNWPATWKAKSIRPYKNMLIAMDVSEGATRYPTKYRWSNIADPGALPTWDSTSPGSQAGSDVLEETQGYIVDGEPLRDYFIMYKEDATYTLQFIGGQFVIANRMILKTRGLLAQRCVKEFYGKHFVVSNGDVFVHDGQNAESVISGKNRRVLFHEIDTGNYKNTFVAPDYSRSEMWICFPENGHTYPNMALIWNWDAGTWTFRDLPNASHIAYGVLPSTEARTINSQTMLINNANWSIDQRLYNPADRTLVMVKPGTTSGNLYTLDDGWTEAGTDMVSFIERRGIKPGEKDGVFLLRAAYPRGAGSEMTFTFGSQDSPTAPVQWDSGHAFTPGTSEDKINLRVTGRYLAVKATFPPNSPGTLNAIDLDIVQVGTR